MNTIRQINIASQHLKEFLKEKMLASSAFKFVSLAKEFDIHIVNTQEACKGKEMTSEEFNELLDTEVEIKNLIPKELITFEVSPVSLIALEPFFKDSEI